jgi:hypothetical protein
MNQSESNVVLTIFLLNLLVIFKILDKHSNSKFFCFIFAVMFLWYDYLILALTLLCSTFIGFYFGCFGTKQSTTTEYLFGDKKTKILPIALSLTVW